MGIGTQKYTKLIIHHYRGIFYIGARNFIGCRQATKAERKVYEQS
ncbi:MAG: hypothetical protein V7L22_24680 [Nostoc sp.]